MPTERQSGATERRHALGTGQVDARSAPALSVALLTGGGDRPYALGIATALARENIGVDFIGSDELESPELRATPQISFLNLRGSQDPKASSLSKLLRLSRYYARLVRYAAGAKPKLFHILWNNKIRFIDRALLMIYYRALGKKVVLTAHNVNTEARDGCDHWLNRLTLRTQYKLCSRIFVHTQGMKAQLTAAPYCIPEEKVTVIPFGINNTVPNTSLSRSDARGKLGLSSDAKVLLFFGNIAPYKGLEYLVEALKTLVLDDPSYRLVIAGRPKGHEGYWSGLKEKIGAFGLEQHTLQRIEFIPDEQIELFFKASDALILPYTAIFQSGVLFLGYSFGLPVLAADVGDLKEDILEGKTGSVFRSRDGKALAEAIRSFFRSELAQPTPTRSRYIKDFANEKYSWAKVAAITKRVYQEL